MLTEAPGTVAVPMSEVGRFAAFTVALAGTIQPPGCHLSVMASASVTENLNSSIRTMPDDSEWLWILGDDHIWAHNCLMHMLSVLDDNPDIDILVPLVVKRNPPFHLVVFHQDDSLVEPRVQEEMSTFRPYEWDEVPNAGVFEIDAAGSAGMLIRRHVLDAMTEPWFRSTGGVILNEDVTFCLDARDRGFRLFATADIVMGHLGIFNVRPCRHEGRWGAKVEFTTPDERYREVFMPDIEEKHALAVNGR